VKKEIDKENEWRVSQIPPKGPIIPAFQPAMNSPLNDIEKVCDVMYLFIILSPMCSVVVLRQEARGGRVDTWDDG